MENTPPTALPDSIAPPRVGASPMAIPQGAMRAARVAAVLFITATATTMAGQMILETLPLGGADLTSAQRNQVSLAVVLEIANGLASAGIALALYPVLRRASELAATGYLGLRIVEGTLGVAAAAFLLAILTADAAEMDLLIAPHDATFLTVLIVFSCGTLLFYPTLYRYRLVPPVLSLWGLVGGAMLLLSCLLILFGRIETGGSVDLVLSLPIWINEMALAGWLLLRGVTLPHTLPGDTHAP